MADKLRSRKIAVLATDGVEQSELEQPRQAVIDAGGAAELISIKSGEIQAMTADTHTADRFQVDKLVSEVSVDDYDGLLLPGGTTNPDTMRQDQPAVEFVRGFFAEGKPVGAICHGPWMLVEADVVRGRTVTSYPSVRTDLRNAGAMVVDEPVVTDQGLVTSRNPNDLPGFCTKIVEEFAEGKHRIQV